MDELWTAPDRIERRADLILLSNAVEITPTILVDVTMTAHNFQQAGPDYLPGRAMPGLPPLRPRRWDPYEWR